jgi:NAD(P)-dependent dehydrogenase (short-subunit alcohol dehydrogenase family)
MWVGPLVIQYHIGKNIMVQLKPIDEQVVVIMGASSGIGRAAALQLAARGAQVVVAARSEQGLHTLIDEIRAGGGQATAVVADVSDAAQVQAVADEAVATYGRIDTWVHCAAVALFAPLEDTMPEEFRRVIDVNLNGQAYGAMAALPYLKRQGGALIHISSMGAIRAVPLQSAYIASKHGIKGFAESLRAEIIHAKLPISVTNIMPATINTPLFDKARTKLGVKPVAPPPVYQPDLVVEAILYAATHPVRHIVVGGSARLIIWTERLAPRVLDAVLGPLAYQLHNTHDPKPADAPTNLFRPIDEYNTVEGSFGRQALRRSLSTWIATHPAAQGALAVGVALGALALLGRVRRV